VKNRGGCKDFMLSKMTIITNHYSMTVGIFQSNCVILMNSYTPSVRIATGILTTHTHY
jgi:hypothetical protein